MQGHRFRRATAGEQGFELATLRLKPVHLRLHARVKHALGDGGDDIDDLARDLRQLAVGTRRSHSAIIARGATAIIPVRKNGRPWKEDCPAALARNETLRATRYYGRIRRAYAAPLVRRSLLILEAVDRIPCSKSRGGKDAVPQVLRRTHRRERPRPPNRQNPHPHRPHQPLQRARHRRDRSRRLNLKGKGQITPQADDESIRHAQMSPKV